MNRLTVIIFVALAVTFFVAPKTSSHARSVEIVAHRGASFDAPENTVAAANLAWVQQADAVETDIRLTKDGELIVSHDSTTKRIDGCDTPIAELNLAQMKLFDVGRRKGPQYAGERMATLDELIATIPNGKRLFVEIKTGAEILPALEQSLARTQATEKSIVLISFNFEVLQLAHRKWPQYSTLWLVGYDGAVSLDQLIERSRAGGLSGLDIDARWPLDASGVGKIKAAGLQLHVWTVDDPSTAQEWIDLGVDGITTNRAGWMRGQLET